MKITSASQFRQILKRGLTKVLNDDARPPDNKLEEQQSVADLNQNLEDISKIHNNLQTNEAKEAFEKHLLKNIEIHIDRWRSEREGSYKS